MGDFHHIQRCGDLSQADLESALESRGTIKELLDRLAQVSAPDSGVPKVLLLFAQVAKTDVDWLDGDLRVELVAAGDMTVLEVLTDLGGGMRERLFTPVAMNTPMDEFKRAAERSSSLLAPLQMKTQAGGRVVFVGTAEARKSTMPPPDVGIDEGSLYQAMLTPLAAVPVQRSITTPGTGPAMAPVAPIVVASPVAKAPARPLPVRTSSPDLRANVKSKVPTLSGHGTLGGKEPPPIPPRSNPSSSSQRAAQPSPEMPLYFTKSAATFEITGAPAPPKAPPKPPPPAPSGPDEANDDDWGDV